MGRPVVHFGISTKNSSKSQTFYSGLFDWKVQVSSPTAGMINTGDMGGIQGHFGGGLPGYDRYVTVYVYVEDLQGCLDKAVSLGGKTVLPPREVAGAGRFAWLADPDGNLIGLWQPIKK